MARTFQDDWWHVVGSSADLAEVRWRAKQVRKAGLRPGNHTFSIRASIEVAVDEIRREREQSAA